MTQLDFCTALSFSENSCGMGWFQKTLVETAEAYLCLNGRKACVLSIKNQTNISVKVEEAKRHWLITALIVVSYATIIFLALALVIKYSFRCNKIIRIKEQTEVKGGRKRGIRRDYSAESKNEEEDVKGNLIKEIIGEKPRDIDHPEALFIIGGCGSGKGTVKQRKISEIFKKASVNIEADQIKTMLPRYKRLVSEGDANAASKVHQESLDIRDALYDLVIREKRNLIFDGTGSDRYFYVGKLKELKVMGYKTSVILVDTPLDIAVKRVASRFLQTGRSVPDFAVRRTNSEARRNFNSYKTLVHSWAVYDNGGQSPQLRSSSASYSRSAMATL